MAAAQSDPDQLRAPANHASSPKASPAAGRPTRTGRTTLCIFCRSGGGFPCALSTDNVAMGLSVAATKPHVPLSAAIVAQYDRNSGTGLLFRSDWVTPPNTISRSRECT